MNQVFKALGPRFKSCTNCNKQTYRVYLEPLDSPINNISHKIRNPEKSLMCGIQCK